MKALKIVAGYYCFSSGSDKVFCKKDSKTGIWVTFTKKQGRRINLIATATLSKAQEIMTPKGNNGFNSFMFLQDAQSPGKDKKDFVRLHKGFAKVA